MKLVLIVLTLSLAWSAAPAPTCSAVYQRALQNDPQLKEAEATRLAALESKPQALAALLPQLAGRGHLPARKRTPGTRINRRRCRWPGGPTIVESFPFNGRVTTTTHKYGIDLRQNLFRWENWVALQRADAQVAQAEADYQAAQQDLIARVAQRYFDVLAAQDDLDAQRGNLESVSRQLDQAEKRYEVGLIAVTDVQEARAAHDSGAAAVIASKRQLASAQEALREITGDDVDSLARPDRAVRARDPGTEQRGSLGRDGPAAEPVAGLEPSGRGHRARERELGARRPFPVARSRRQPLQAHERRRLHQRRQHAVRQRRASINIRTRSASSSASRSIRAAWCPRRCARRSTSIAPRRSGSSASPARPSMTPATPISGCCPKSRMSRRCAARSNRTRRR